MSINQVIQINAVTQPTKRSINYSFGFWWVGHSQQDFTLYAKYQCYQKSISEGEILLHQQPIYLYQLGLTSGRNAWVNYTTGCRHAITHPQEKSFQQWSKLIW